MPARSLVGSISWVNILCLFENYRNFKKKIFDQAIMNFN